MQTFFFTVLENGKHKSFVLKYFDRGISKSSNGITNEAKSTKCAAVIKCTCGLTSGMLWHLKSKHSIEKPCWTQSSVSSNTQCASSTKRFNRAYSQATLHMTNDTCTFFHEKKTGEEILIKLLHQMVFLPV